MTSEPRFRTINLAEQAKAIELVLQEAVRRALLTHKRLGNPIAISKDGEVVIIPPEEIVISAEPALTETVLLVEGDDDVRWMMQHSLGARGYDVLTANTVESALAIAREYRGEIHHIVISDGLRLDTEASRLSEEMRRLHPNLKLIYMTAPNDRLVGRHGVLDKRLESTPEPFVADAPAPETNKLFDSSVE